MLNRTVAMVAIAALITSGSFAQAEKLGSKEKEKEIKLDGIKCLFCKMQVTKDVSVDYKGAKVFLGCEGCVGAFKENVKKVAAKANAQLVATKQAKQKACPISGQPVDDKIHLVVAKAKVKFCCSKCKSAAEDLKDDAQIEKLFGEATFKKAFKVTKSK